MKKFTVLSAIVGMLVVAVLFFAQNGKTKLTGCLLSNVEALTLDEDEDKTQCPDYNYAPDNKIYAEKSSETVVVCRVEGELKIGNDKFEGSYEKEVSYNVTYCTKNCTDSRGACCDQREVGVSILSCTPQNSDVDDSNNNNNRTGRKRRK